MRSCMLLELTKCYLTTTAEHAILAHLFAFLLDILTPPVTFLFYKYKPQGVIHYNIAHVIVQLAQPITGTQPPTPTDHMLSDQ